jgi:hypothetical protein
MSCRALAAVGRSRISDRAFTSFNRSFVRLAMATTSASLTGRQHLPKLFESPGKPMPSVMVRATTILAEFEQVQGELIGTAVILTDGKAGTVETVWLDELHGLRIAIRGHDGKWPVSTIKLAQAR